MRREGVVRKFGEVGRESEFVIKQRQATCQRRQATRFIKFSIVKGHRLKRRVRHNRAKSPSNPHRLSIKIGPCHYNWAMQEAFSSDYINHNCLFLNRQKLDG